MLLSIIKIYNPYAGLSNSHRRNIVKASFCLSAHSARVKEAQVESCEYTKTKWVVVLCNFVHTKLPRPEDIKLILNNF